MSYCEDLNQARRQLFEALGENTKKYCQLMKLWFSMKLTLRKTHMCLCASFTCKEWIKKQTYALPIFKLHVHKISSKPVQWFNCKMISDRETDPMTFTFMYCKLTKEEFDSEARRMMNPEQTHLHNVFLLCLFNKCGGLSRATSKTKLKDFKKLKINKSKRNGDKGSFQLADPVNYLPQLESPPQHLQDEPQRYCVQELFLPDHSLILGRLMLTSWEMGMEGAEENAAEILVHAVQYFLKNILTVIISQRNGYKLRENKMIFSLGSPVPNPWLRNTQGIIDDTMYSKMIDVTEVEDGNVHIPKIPLTAEELERREMYRLACANIAPETPLKRPVSTYDVFQALQVHKSTIPSHSLYAMNMDKIIAAFNHPSHEEIEAAKYFVNS